MRFKVAIRNTFRNGRRTALNVLMIASGVTAIILFRGFTSHLLLDLQETTIRTQTGHFQLAPRSYWDKSGNSPKDDLLKDYPKLVEILRGLPHVRTASGRISFFGLVSGGERTFSARGISVDPEAERSRLTALHLVQGEPFRPGDPFQMLLGEGLAKSLRAKVGQSLSVVGYTYDGVINALDVQVAGVFRSGLSDFDDTTFYLPLESAQRLLDTDRVEQILVTLDRTDLTPEIASQAESLASGIDSRISVKTWFELSHFYHQSASFFRTQNRVLAFIIVCLVVLGVLNTVGMSIMERAGEIGTLRALGETEKTVMFQFVTEGVILGMIGAVVGAIAGVFLAHVITALELPIVVPTATTPLKVGIQLLFSAFVEAMGLAVLSAALAAFVPAWRASRMNIVDALRRNI